MLKLFVLENCSECERVEAYLKSKNIDFETRNAAEFIANSDYMAEAAFNNVDFTKMPIGILESDNEIFLRIQILTLNDLLSY